VSSFSYFFVETFYLPIHFKSVYLEHFHNSALMSVLLNSNISLLVFFIVFSHGENHHFLLHAKHFEFYETLGLVRISWRMSMFIFL
jgi:hypothetical protein